MLADLRHAIRALRRTPTFTIVAVLCLGLGLGANALVFGIVNALTVRPFPFREPATLVGIMHRNTVQGWFNDELPFPILDDVRAEVRGLAGVTAFQHRFATIAAGGEPEGYDATEVLPGYFELLGVRPLAGRGFVQEEGARGAERVVALGEGLWRRRYAADPAIVGRAVLVDGVPHTVVGVIPDGTGLAFRREALWLPLRPPATPDRSNHSYGIVARLAPGATLGQVQREMAALSARLQARHPASDHGWEALAVPLRDRQLPTEIRATFGAMLGAVALVLLIAVANVANLSLVRAAGRVRELATRTALGAPRWRVVRQLLVEGLLVSVAGFGLAMLIGRIGIAWLARALPRELPGWVVLTLDWRVAAYAGMLAVLASLGFGLLPALRATRAVAATLRDGGRGASSGVSGRRGRNLLVAGELALSVVLMAGAGLLVKSFLQLQRVDPGFRAGGVLGAGLYFAGPRQATAGARAASASDLVARVRALPGVEDAAIATTLPLDGTRPSTEVFVEGRANVSGEAPSAEWRSVSDGYLATMHIPLLAGRDFTAAEAADTNAGVVLVNAAFARKVWPGESPIGRRIAVGGGQAPWRTVVGLTGDVRQRELGEAPWPQVYLPQGTWMRRRVALLVRTSGAPTALAAEVRRTVAAVDPNIPLLDPRALAEHVQRSLWLERLYGMLFGAFGATALALAVIGVYGVIAYAVAQRTRELGVRMALGASPRDVLRLVMGQGGRLVVAGLVAGLVGALGLTRALAAALHGVDPHDPAVLALVVLVLGVAGLLASWLPARRAATVDPAITLRAE